MLQPMQSCPFAPMQILLAMASGERCVRRRRLEGQEQRLRQHEAPTAEAKGARRWPGEAHLAFVRALLFHLLCFFALPAHVVSLVLLRDTRCPSAWACLSACAATRPPARSSLHWQTEGSGTGTALQTDEEGRRGGGEREDKEERLADT